MTVHANFISTSFGLLVSWPEMQINPDQTVYRSLKRLIRLLVGLQAVFVIDRLWELYAGIVSIWKTKLSQMHIQTRYTCRIRSLTQKALIKLTAKAVINQLWLGICNWEQENALRAFWNVVWVY